MLHFGYRVDENLEYKDIRRQCLEIEKLGFDSFWLSDHLMKGYYLECWTVLSSLSSITENIRLGTMVLCNSYRHPPLVAKMAATLDIISGGRLELGMGAGWYESEYNAYGVPFPETSIRIEQLKEAIQIIKKMWTEDSATHAGKYYSVRDVVLDPKPVQKPHPRVWIGGAGEKIMMKAIAEVGDGYILRYGATPSEYGHKIGVLKRHCENVGRSYDNISRRAWGGHVFIGRTPREVKKKIASFKPKYPSEASKRYFEQCICGTPEECMERTREYSEVGVTDFIVSFPREEQTEMSAVRLFAEEVVSSLGGR